MIKYGKFEVGAGAVAIICGTIMWCAAMWAIHQ